MADTESCPITGLSTCERLNFSKRIMTVNSGYSDLIDEFSDVFGEIGRLDKEHHIEVDPNVTPSVNPPRKVPIALMGKLKDELNRMEKFNIIEKVSHPTDWVNNIVIVEKSNGSVPAQLDSLAHFDSRQIGPGLIWRGSNWAKESLYGLGHKTIEQNKFYDSMSLSYILLCSSLALSGIQSIFGMKAPLQDRHQPTTSLLW